jgi:hypothetical protein
MSRQAMNWPVTHKKTPIMTHAADRDRLQLIVSYAASGKLADAEAACPRSWTRPPAIEAWRVIARTKTNLQRFGRHEKRSIRR